jgi:hypothetical protein
MTLDEKLDEALKGTFPASDPFYIAAVPIANDDVEVHAGADQTQEKMD